MLERLEDNSGGKVNYTEFMEKLGVVISPGDLDGLSTQIHERSHKAEAERLQDLIQKYDQISPFLSSSSQNY